jgi:drug/metabolite transporter (DMT)-like permease
MKIKLFPRAKYGKWSIYFILAFAIFLAVFLLLVESGERGGATFFSNLKLTIPFLAAAISAIAAFFTGLFSVFKEKNHSVLVYFAIIVGLFVLIFLIGEFTYPH